MNKTFTPQQLINGYLNGYFPMADSDTEEILWYSPDPRAIIPIKTYKEQKSLRPILNKKKFDIRFNTSFEKIMEGCASLRKDEEGTWISKNIIKNYCTLHQLGLAHSVEAFYNNELVGGLYGVALGAAFFGESMFYKVPNASKVCFHYLIERLKEKKFELLDTQFMNDNVIRFGAIEIPKEEYLIILQEAVCKKVSFI